jgi:hypothetical protein
LQINVISTLFTSYSGISTCNSRTWTPISGIGVIDLTPANEIDSGNEIGPAEEARADALFRRGHSKSIDDLKHDDLKHPSSTYVCRLSVSEQIWLHQNLVMSMTTYRNISARWEKRQSADILTQLQNIFRRIPKENRIYCDDYTRWVRQRHHFNLMSTFGSIKIIVNRIRRLRNLMQS